MTHLRYDDIDGEYTYEKPLIREAVEALVENHREEYDSLVTGTQVARILELEDQVRRKEQAIEACRRQLKKYEEDRKRRKQRVKSGVTELKP